MATNQPVWTTDGIVSATTQGFLGAAAMNYKLGSLPVVAKNDTRRLFGKQLSMLINKELVATSV